MLELVTTQDICFEPVRTENVTELKHISEQLFYITFHAANTPEDIRVYLDRAFNIRKLQAELAEQTNLFYFVKKENAIIGYIKLQQDFDREDPTIPASILNVKSLLLDRFYLHPTYHGSEVAHHMMQFCLDTAKSLNMDTLWLGVWEKNARAMAFYKKWQFVVVGQHLFRMGKDGQTDYWMAHTFRPAA